MSNKIATIIALIKSGKLSKAIIEIDKELEKSRSKQSLLRIKADVLRKQNKIQEAAEQYMAAAKIDEGDSQICWYNAGALLQRLGDYNRSVICYKQSLAIDINHHQSRNNLCVLLYKLNKTQEAITHAKWIAKNSTNPEHLINSGFVLRAGDCLDEADIVFKRALEIEPENPKYIAAALQSAEYVCDWDTLEKLSEKLLTDFYLTEKIEESRELHHVHISWCDDEAINLRMAKAATQRIIGDIKPIYTHQNHRFSEKIKVGYVSSDFFNHATLHLLIGVLERHDKSKFEIYAYCHSMIDTSSYRKRFIECIDNFRDISKVSDLDAAQLIKEDKIDILIDLKGFTDKGRLKIFAYRPAPIQVTYLGYPGTSGAEFFDYVLTDKYVTPDESKPFYTEKLCRLPTSYQCNDNSRPVASNTLARENYNLPDGAFVFCCFNQTYKIDRIIFGAWVQILKRVENSVIWIINPGEDALKRLKGLLSESGINPDRLIPAEKVAPLIHLKRLKDFADIALDTRIVNGHTTTSDALWCDVPVITLYGNHFNSRVSSSLLANIGLESLITRSIPEYIDKAVSIANSCEVYKSIKNKLASNKFSYPLFDTESFTKNFEASFEMMVLNFQRKIVDHIDVPLVASSKSKFIDSIPERLLKIDINDKSNTASVISKYFDVRILCPLCHSESNKSVRKSKLELNTNKEILQVSSTWQHCNDCGHVYKKESLLPEFYSICNNEYPLPKINRVDCFSVIDKVKKHMIGSNINGDKNILVVNPTDPNFFGVCLEFGINVSAVVDKRDFNFYKSLSKSVVSTGFIDLKINGSPDFIYIGRLLENVVDPMAYMYKISRSISQTGIVAIAISNHSSFEWFQLREEEKFEVWDNFRTNNLYSRLGIINLFNLYGFEVLEQMPVTNNDAGLVILFQKINVLH